MAVSMTACKAQRRNFMNLKICPSNDFASKKKMISLVKKKQIQGNLGKVTY